MAENSMKNELMSDHSEWMLEKSYLENQVSFLKSTLNENKKLHDALLVCDGGAKDSVGKVRVLSGLAFLPAGFLAPSLGESAELDETSLVGVTFFRPLVGGFSAPAKF